MVWRNSKTNRDGQRGKREVVKLKKKRKKRRNQQMKVNIFKSRKHKVDQIVAWLIVFVQTQHSSCVLQIKAGPVFIKTCTWFPLTNVGQLLIRFLTTYQYSKMAEVNLWQANVVIIAWSGIWLHTATSKECDDVFCMWFATKMHLFRCVLWIHEKICVFNVQFAINVCWKCTLCLWSVQT